MYFCYFAKTSSTSCQILFVYAFFNLYFIKIFKHKKKLEKFFDKNKVEKNLKILFSSKDFENIIIYDDHKNL